MKSRPTWLQLFHLELGNGSGQVGFVFVSNLNGLTISQPEPNLFIKGLKTLPEPNLFIKRVDAYNPFKIN